MYTTIIGAVSDEWQVHYIESRLLSVSQAPR